jgi:hypothetical protein
MVDASLGFGVGGDAKKRMQLHQSLLAALVGTWHPRDAFLPSTVWGDGPDLAGCLLTSRKGSRWAVEVPATWRTKLSQCFADVMLPLNLVIFNNVPHQTSPVKSWIL